MLAKARAKYKRVWEEMDEADHRAFNRHNRLLTILLARCQSGWPRVNMARWQARTAGWAGADTLYGRTRFSLWPAQPLAQPACEYGCTRISL